MVVVASPLVRLAAVSHVCGVVHDGCDMICVCWAEKRGGKALVEAFIVHLLIREQKVKSQPLIPGTSNNLSPTATETWDPR